FNHRLGACPECRGFGRTIAIDLNRAIPDRSLSITQGVVRVFRGQEMGESQKDLLRACAREEIDVHRPFEELPKADQDFVINGEKRGGEYTDQDYENDRWYGVRGFFRWLESKTYKMHVRVLLSRYRAYVKCPSCEGGRYQPEALNYKIAAAVCNGRNQTNGAHSAPQRVNLTTCLGASLVNTLFVMDEPSVGLHPRDVGRLVRVMHNLRDKGNTLLVVEHDEQIIRAADNLIDIGPGRGERGGELVWTGQLDKFMCGSAAPRTMPNIIAERSKKSRFAASALRSPAAWPIQQSLTRDYLTREKSIPIPK